MSRWFNAVLSWVLDPNNLTAISTTVIAFFTIVLAWVGYCQARLIRKSIDLARAEFLSTHRPKLRIRRIFLREPLAIGQTIKIRILAANIGDTDTTIDSLGLEIYIGEALPTAEPSPYVAPRIPAGKVAMIDGEGPVYSEIDKFHVVGGLGLYVVGVINYRDDTGIVRTTAFARYLDRGGRRFVPVPNDHPESDREYED